MNIKLIILLTLLISGCAENSAGVTSDADTIYNAVDKSGVYILKFGINVDSTATAEFSRSDEITNFIMLANDTDDIFSGFVETYITVNCEGNNPWVMINRKQTTILSQNANFHTAARTCSDLPVTSVKLVGTIYGPDQLTVIDKVVFDLNIIQ